MPRTRQTHPDSRAARLARRRRLRQEQENITAAYFGRQPRRFDGLLMEFDGECGDGEGARPVVWWNFGSYVEAVED